MEFVAKKKLLFVLTAERAERAIVASGHQMVDHVAKCQREARFEAKTGNIIYEAFQEVGGKSASSSIACVLEYANVGLVAHGAVVVLSCAVIAVVPGKVDDLYAVARPKGYAMSVAVVLILPIGVAWHNVGAEAMVVAVNLYALVAIGYAVGPIIVE